MRATFLCTVLTMCYCGRSVSGDPVYKAVGDTAVLTPDFDHEAVPITSISWKQGADMAVQWDGHELVAYRDFRVRGTLDNVTGALVIANLTERDSEVYTPEINDEVIAAITLKVISRVPKPTISVSCDPEGTVCSLTCEGDTAGAEPVAYVWNDDVETPRPKLNITKDEQTREFSCLMRNAVSASESENVLNPFMTRNRTPTLLILGPIGLLIACVVYLVYKFRTGRKDARGQDQGTTSTPIHARV